MKKPAGALEISLYFLNLRIGADWRRAVARPFETRNLELSGDGRPFYGLVSAAQVQDQLRPFQDFGADLVALDPARGGVSDSIRVTLLKELYNRAAPVVEGFVLERETGRLAFRWSTKEESFEETLYSTLALALNEAPFWPIGRCEGCTVFFAKPSHRPVKYCSARCRKRLEVARYRQRTRPDVVAGKRRGKRPGQTTSMGVDKKTKS